MKIDLHVHSKYSTRPSQWILQKLGCPESFTEPLQLYRIAKKKGMSLVTITDHNTIQGCLEIGHLPDVFISEEVTTYFPEDGCKAHVLVYDIDEGTHADLQKVRENIFDLVHYLREKQITHVLAHPLYAVNDRLTVGHVEKFLLLFKNFELNGARDQVQNESLRAILSHLSPGNITRLMEKHRMAPHCSEPWRKNLAGGSDDHSSLNIARQYTEIEDVANLDEFLAALTNGKGRVMGRTSTPHTMAHNLYGIAYQFYKNKLNMERHVTKDLFLRFLDRFLQADQEDESGLWSRLYYLWNRSKRSRRKAPPPRALQDLLRYETQKLIWDDPKLMQIVRSGNGDTDRLGRTWFEFVNRASNKVLFHFGNHLLDHLSGANFFNIFQSIGSAGALYSVLAPYFVAFSLFNTDRESSRRMLTALAPTRSLAANLRPDVKVAHFTDTYHEVNGVAVTLQQQVRLALKTNKDLTVITCHAEKRSNGKGLQNFAPIGVYELPEYPEQKLYYPPFLEMLSYCYEQDFTHIHTATPGPIGLAALAIARILKLPVSGTYHTALPQYARYLTEDGGIEELVWKYTLWYYNQLDFIYVPSRSTGQELVDKGIRSDKIQLFPRGADIERFHPGKRDPAFLEERWQIREGIKLLYVGRVSKEKNLALLGEVFRALSEWPVTLIIVGDGPYLQEFKESMRGTRCVFPGYLAGEDLAKVYASCDLFVFPSTTDTFGNVILEAQASGVPVIVSNAGGPRENIIPGSTGLVVEGDDVKSLHDAVRSLVCDPQRLRSMSKAARQYMQGRSFEQAFEKAWAMYRGQEMGSEWDLAKAV